MLHYAMLMLSSVLFSSIQPKTQGMDAALSANLSLAESALKNDSGFLGRVRIRLNANSIQVSLRQAPLDSLFGSPADSESIGLEALIRKRAVERDLKSSVGVSPEVNSALLQIENLAKGLLISKPREQSKSTSKVIESLFRGIDRQVKEIARKKGLEFVDIKDASEGFKIKFTLSPASGKLHMMPYLRYRKCLAFHESLDPFYEVYSTGMHTLIGRYHFITKWAGGREESDDISFLHEGEVVFTPPVSR